MSAALLLSPLLRLGPALLLLPTARGLGGRLLWAALVLLVLLPLFVLGHPASAGAPLAPWLWRELWVGAAVGLWTSVPLTAAAGAGRLWAAVLPAGQAGWRPLATLTQLVAAAVYFASGGPRLLLLALAHSYQALPLDPAAVAPPAARLLPLLLHIPLAALLLATPVLAALLLAALAVALLRRLLGGAPEPALAPLLLLIVLVAALPLLWQAAGNLQGAYGRLALPAP